MKIGRSGLRLDADVAAVVLRDDALDDVEAEAGAEPDRLGGEERLEDARLDVLGNAVAIVDDPDDDGCRLRW